MLFRKFDLMVLEKHLQRKPRNSAGGIIGNGSKSLHRIRENGFEHTISISERDLEKLGRGSSSKIWTKDQAVEDGSANPLRFFSVHLSAALAPFKGLWKVLTNRYDYHHSIGNIIFIRVLLSNCSDPLQRRVNSVMKNQLSTFTGTGNVTQTDRLYYLDWLRVFAILSVLFLHCAKIFDYSTTVVFNTSRSPVLSAFREFGLLWIMPLFFILSGAAVFCL